MCRFIETIRIENGMPCNIEAHEQRLNHTRRLFFPDCEPVSLKSILDCEPYKDRTRCRVEYARDIIRIEYLPYTLRRVKSLRCIKADHLDYSFKSADRTELNALYGRREDADEILIVRNNLLTDTSIGNIALWDGSQWVTPHLPLLRGTMRRKLLQERQVVTGTISLPELAFYQKIRLFNAMIDFGEIELPVSAIIRE